jgi:hypothetical protein
MVAAVVPQQRLRGVVLTRLTKRRRWIVDELCPGAEDPAGRAREGLVRHVKRARIVVVYAFMYLGGPLLWGGWMIFRLGLLSPGEYARCLLSPLTLAMLAAFLAGNLVNVHRAADVRSILRAHCASLVAFGTVGTFVFLVPLSADAGDWLSTAGIGALSGASLVFLVYGYITVVIFRIISGNADILKGVRRFYSRLFPLGAFYFVTVAALSGRLQGLTPQGGASLALPLATTGILFIKTMSRGKVVRGGVTHDAA